MKGTSPPIVKSSIRSCSCPWISPQMVTGALTGVVFVYSEKIAMALSVMNLTCFSVMDLKFLRLSMIMSTYALSDILFK